MKIINFIFVHETAFEETKSAEILEKHIKGVSDLKFMRGNTFEFDGEKIYVTRSGYTGEDGFEISVLKMWKN